MKRILAVGVMPKLLPTNWLNVLDRALGRRFNSYGGKISVACVGMDAMSRINAAYRRRTGPTDVLSFQFERRSQFGRSRMLQQQKNRRIEKEMIGEVLLCPPLVRTRARRERRPYIREFQYLTVHGILHVLGFSHETFRARQTMESLERTLLGEIAKQRKAGVVHIVRN